MDLSIVIPCYNHGEFLLPLIESLKPIDNIEYEVIIVNDGSTDEGTVKLLNGIKSKYEEVSVTVLHQNNGGPSKARNTGIENSKGKYMLPIDSDNWIDLEYIIQSKKILDQHSEVDIVYAKPVLIGEEIKQSRLWVVKDFDRISICKYNYIDTCAVYRREVWVKNNGYDTNRTISGWEDWDFWLASSANGFKFYFLNANLFYYRIIADSHLEKLANDNREELALDYITKKHARFIHTVLRETYIPQEPIINNDKLIIEMYKNDFDKPFRSFFKYLLYKIKNTKPDFFK
jgi:glycosyltransferase involved in cell wall biosynthesis